MSPSATVLHVLASSLLAARAGGSANENFQGKFSRFPERKALGDCVLWWGGGGGGGGGGGVLYPPAIERCTHGSVCVGGCAQGSLR